VRRFTDEGGRVWDVVVGRESWGTLYALFIPVGRGRTEPVRQTLLEASGYEAAQQELDALPPAELNAMLRRSQPKET
jgi:hypothetical protein